MRILFIRTALTPPSKAMCRTLQTLEARVPQGAFSPTFTDRIIKAVQQVRTDGKLGLSKRS